LVGCHEYQSAPMNRGALQDVAEIRKPFSLRDSEAYSFLT